MKTLIFLFIVLFAIIDARLFEGQCRDLPAPIVSPFDYKLYLGIWYEVWDGTIIYLHKIIDSN